LRLWPYQKQIADCISDPQYERITMLKAARLGFTTLLTGALGHFAVNEPCPVLCLLPTESDCRDYAVTEIETTFENSPTLSGLLSSDNSEHDRSTLLSRKFPGGSLKLVPAKTPRALRRHTARVLLIDESDAMLPTPEGDALALAEARTLSFPNRKIIIGSTPTFADTSPILRAYEASDARVFELPCPACGAFHELQWSDIRWEPDQPESAHYLCPSCGACVEERHKAAMVAAGRWRATREVKGHAGFRISALNSLLANCSWKHLVVEFLAAKADPTLLQVFTNLSLAQGWQGASGEMLDENKLAARAESFSLAAIPEAVIAITVGIDLQDDRAEATICGWDKTNTAYVLDHQIIWGAFTDDLTWAEVDQLLKSRWRHKWGGLLRVDAAVIDAGDGDHAASVLAFTAPRLARRIFAGKGVYGTRPAFEVSKTKKGTARLAIIGVDVLKTQLLDKLARGAGIHFGATLPLVYFEQLASERRILKYKFGRPVRRFERIAGRAAEALDALVYAFAARQAFPLNVLQRVTELKEGPRRPPPTQSGFIGPRPDWFKRRDDPSVG
jgi:phage terminase large subunit GpA-like protein